jgi:hypothetical protein
MQKELQGKRASSYLAREDPLSGEAVFVGTHLAAMCGLWATKNWREFGVDER